MDDIWLVTIPAVVVALINGPVIICMNRRGKKDDDLKELQGDMTSIKQSLERVGDGLNIGLLNDKVIFKALREHCINGDSEAQEHEMDAYLTRCTIAALK